MNPTLTILQHLAEEQGNKHRYIPFLLKSEASAAEMQMIKQQVNSKFTFALYAPYLYTNSNNGITRKLYEYIIRRKEANGELGINGDIPAFDDLDAMKKALLRNYAAKLSLYGDFSTISNEITNKSFCSNILAIYLHLEGFDFSHSFSPIPRN